MFHQQSIYVLIQIRLRPSTVEARNKPMAKVKRSIKKDKEPQADNDMTNQSGEVAGNSGEHKSDKPSPGQLPTINLSCFGSERKTQPVFS